MTRRLDEETQRQDVFTRVVLQVFHLNGRLLEIGDLLAAPAGQTSARWQVLGVIDHEPITVAATARSMGLTRQSVQRTVDRLVADGLAELVDNPADRRAQLVRLTTSGRKSLRQIETAQRSWVKSVAPGLGAKRLEQLEAGLTALETALSPRDA